MITILKGTDKGLVKVEKFEKDVWINVTNPPLIELERLIQELDIPPDFLMDSLDIDERARIEVDGKFTLVLLRIPRFDKSNADVPFTTLPLGIIFTKDYVLTICLEKSDVILDISNSGAGSLTSEDRGRFILHIFRKTVLLYLKYLKEINKRTDTIERELHKSMRNEELIKLLNIEKSLVLFTTSLKSNEIMMERLQKMAILKSNQEYIDLLEDIIIDNRQAIEMANIYSNILSGMMDAFASVISNNMNIVIKFLTAVTILLMVPTLIVSAYGMNVKLPFQNSQHAFLIIFCISLGLTILSTVLFIKRRWF
ncbi:MAG: magnesium transporter CorA family protein [bacterium]